MDHRRVLGWQLASSQPIPSMGAMDSSLLIWSHIVFPLYVALQPTYSLLTPYNLQPTYVSSSSPFLRLLTTTLIGVYLPGCASEVSRLARKQYGTAPRPEAAVDYITRCHRFKFRLLLNL